MKYNNVVINYNSDGEFIFSDFETNKGNIYVTNKKQHDENIKEFAAQEGITIEEFMKRNDLVQIKKEERHSDFDDDMEDEEDNKREKSQKFKKWVKRLIATAAVIVLATCGYSLDKRKKVFGGRIYALFHPKEKIESSFKGGMFDANDSDVVSINISTSVGNGGDNEYNEYIANVNEKADVNSQIIWQVATNDVVNFNNEEIMEALNANLHISNGSLLGVSQYINDREFDETAYYYNFENLFQPGTTDYNSVFVFSKMRNDIIEMAFSKKDPNEIKKIIKNYYKMFTDYSVLNKKCKYKANDQEIVLNYDELSDMAKLVILELGDSMMMVDCDYSYNDGEVDFDKSDVIEQNESLRNDLLRKIVNKGYRK